VIRQARLAQDQGGRDAGHAQTDLPAGQDDHEGVCQAQQLPESPAGRRAAAVEAEDEAGAKLGAQHATRLLEAKDGGQAVEAVDEGAGVQHAGDGGEADGQDEEVGAVRDPVNRADQVVARPVDADLRLALRTQDRLERQVAPQLGRLEVGDPGQQARLMGVQVARTRRAPRLERRRRAGLVGQADPAVARVGCERALRSRHRVERTVRSRHRVERTVRGRHRVERALRGGRRVEQTLRGRRRVDWEQLVGLSGRRFLRCLRLQRLRLQRLHII
jgi:hypothetical protein